jgi:hypothetical protein
MSNSVFIQQHKPGYVEKLKDGGMGGVIIRSATAEYNMCSAVVDKIFSYAERPKNLHR